MEAAYIRTLMTKPRALLTRNERRVLNGIARKAARVAMAKMRKTA